MEEKKEQKPKVERVLIVDDEQEMLDSLKRRFEIEDIEVEVAQNPLDALEIVKKDSINVVLTDIKMPDMDGVELLGRLKDMNPLCNVIIMTAYSNMSYLLDCFRAGASDYFAKPFGDVEIVVEAVKNALRRVSRLKKGLGFYDFPGTP